MNSGQMQILARLDDTQIKSNLAIVTRRLDELAARRARLEAERDEQRRIEFPADLIGRMSESRLFDLRRTAQAGQKEQLQSLIDQLRKEYSGLAAQEQAKAKELDFIDQELSGLRDLWQKKLISLQRITASERDAARLGGERGQLLASQAQTEGRISEIKLQIIQIDQDTRSEVAKELREIEAQTSELLVAMTTGWISPFSTCHLGVDCRKSLSKCGRIAQNTHHKSGDVFAIDETMCLGISRENPAACRRFRAQTTRTDDGCSGNDPAQMLLGPRLGINCGAECRNGAFRPERRHIAATDRRHQHEPTDAMSCGRVDDVNVAFVVDIAAVGRPSPKGRDHIAGEGLAGKRPSNVGSRESVPAHDLYANPFELRAVCRGPQHSRNGNVKPPEELGQRAPNPPARPENEDRTHVEPSRCSGSLASSVANRATWSALSRRLSSRPTKILNIASPSALKNCTDMVSIPMNGHALATTSMSGLRS